MIGTHLKTQETTHLHQRVSNCHAGNAARAENKLNGKCTSVSVHSGMVRLLALFLWIIFKKRNLKEKEGGAKKL